MTKPRGQKVEISIAVLCSPRNDALAAGVMMLMAEGAAKTLPKKRAHELMNQVQRWIAEHNLGPKPHKLSKKEIDAQPKGTA